MKKFKIKKGDVVVVTAGKHKGKTGKVLKVLRHKDRVLVDKVNEVKRHIKPTSERPGTIATKEAPIHISNVALWNQEEERKMKVGWKVIEGRKVRVDKKTDSIIDKG